MNTRSEHSLLRPLTQAFRVLWKASPSETTLSVALMLVQAAIPGLLLYLQKRIIDETATRMDMSVGEQLTTAIIVTIAAYAVFTTIQDTAETVRTVFSDRLHDRVSIELNQTLIGHVNTFATLDLHENPSNLDALRLAQEGQEKLHSLIWTGFSALTAIISLVPVMAIVGSVTWWTPIILIVSIAPGVYVTFVGPKMEWEARELVAPDERSREILAQLAVDSAYARDLRLLGMAPMVTSRWRSTALDIALTLNRVRLTLVRKTIAFDVLCGLLIAIPIAWAASRALGGDITIGSMAMVITSIMALRGAFMTIIANGGQVSEELRGIAKFFDFIDIKPPATSSYNAEPLPRLKTSFAMNQVTFAYPGAAEPTLHNLSLVLHRGESVALVGANGAGKTTISRMLSRLFDPTAGEITWDGIAVRDRDAASLRHRLAVVPQDFARFPLTLRENISIGRLTDPPTDAEVMRALQDVGLGYLVEQGPAALDAPLTKEFDNGRQLSGGEWQRLAIARALIRREQADVMILDEPTAALDPATEVEIARLMLDASRGKSSIIISHRLGICTLVDRVIVLDHGRIVEDGSHKHLMAVNGTYADMFRAQAAWYQN